jgi:zinc protease
MMQRDSISRLALSRLAASAVIALGFALAALAGSQPADAAVEIREVVSPGGITAWLVEDDTVPLIAMSFAFHGGSAQDPAGRQGVSNMLSGLLDEGAGELDSQAFQGRLDELSISLSYDSGKDAFYGTLRTLAVNRDEAFRLLRLSLNQPRFDDEPVERIRAQILTGIRANANDPEVVANDRWMEILFPDHPYGRPTEGTPETVAAITADDLRDYVAKNLARENLRISVVGAIDEATLAAALDDIFGPLPEKPDQVAVADVTPTAAARVDITMDVPQSVLRWGGTGPKRDDPDFIPVYIADYILGGGSFSSRLYREVREKRGLAYSVFTGLAPFEHSGLAFGGTATRADRAEEAMAIIEAEVRRFIEEGPTEEEVEKAKAYLIGSYALRFTSSGAIARQLLGIQMDNLGIDYINRRNEMIQAVTVDEVREAAKRLYAGGLVVVKVGQPGA